ncbi:MAG TPA: hypothetical protein DCR44_03350 [Acholeplasmatales bacterium]|nr:MAG: hypothetical protein A2Y16_00985 [Tenericutes bacterium GWF2_57_13]HAQ56425.1 hypothetical protein [Acholeplasmatales bacterium]
MVFVFCGKDRIHFADLTQVFPIAEFGAMMLLRGLGAFVALERLDGSDCLVNEGREGIIR